MPLTIKQVRFIQEYLKCGNASDAYRKAYNCANSSPESVKVNACKLFKNTNIALTITNLQAEAQKVCLISVATQTEKLETLIKLATEKGELTAAVNAVMGQAKLHGLLNDKYSMNINNTQINTAVNVISNHELARKVAFMLAKAAVAKK